MQPFIALSESVPGSKRKSHVVAGGYKRKHLNHPDHMWVDSYSGIKTPTVNATISCRIKDVGAEPEIVINENDEPSRCYSISELDNALQDWETIIIAAKFSFPGWDGNPNRLHVGAGV